MNYWSLQQIKQETGGYIVGHGDIAPKSLSIDTRTIKPGDCFVALRGQRDGHLFANNAVTAGASSLIVDHVLSLDIPQLVVNDTLKALYMWGKSRFKAVRPSLVFGVTGSVGKTSSKNLLAAATNSWKTLGNRNNTLGISEVLATLPSGISTAVLEMGISKPGEMKLLVDIAPVNYGLLTNIGISHIVNFDCKQENIAKEKGELIKNLIPGGAWSYLKADPWANWIAQQYKYNQTLAIPVGPGTEFYWKDTVSLGVHGEQFIFCFPGGEILITLRLRGIHNIVNASLVAAIAIQAGFNPKLIADGLATVEPEMGRGCIHLLRNGGWLLDETYNANYDSIMACVKYMLDMDGGKPIAILGCITELGSKSEQVHYQLGCDLKKAGIAAVLAYGNYADILAKGFGANAKAFYDYESLRDNSGGLSAVDSSCRILVKGSRYWAAERVVSWLIDHIGI